MRPPAISVCLASRRGGKRYTLPIYDGIDLLAVAWAFQKWETLQDKYLGRTQQEDIHILYEFVQALHGEIHKAGENFCAILGLPVDPYVAPFLRWVAHQSVEFLHVNELEGWGYELTVWPVPDSEPGPEVSLFLESSETVDERMIIPDRAGIIKLTTTEAAQKYPVRLRDNWDWLRYQNFGWRDYLGEHVEFWDPDQRLYVRRSMTRRTQYVMRFDESGNLVSVS